MFRGKEDEPMFRNNLRRGTTALLFVTALMVAGAQPAAAQGFGWREALDWLSRLCGGITLRTMHHQDPADAVKAGYESDSGGGPAANADCGPEIDPNGVPKCKPTGSASGG